MWDWKQLLWIKYFGWGPSVPTKGTLGMLLKVEGIILFTVPPSILVGQIIYLVLSLQNGNYKEALTTITEFAATLQMAWKTFKCAYQRSEVKSIIKDMEELDQRQKRYFMADEKSDLIMKTHTRYCSKYFRFAILTFLLSIHWAIRPITLAFSGNYVPVAHAWVPWNDKVFLGWLRLWTINTIFIITCVSGLMSYESLILSFKEMTIAFLKIISHGLSSLKFETGNARDGLRELHEMHKEALKINNKIKAYTNIVTQLDCLLYTFSMCCGVLEITLGWSSTERKANIVELLFILGIFFFMQCHRCQTVTFAFSSVASAAYNNDWYNGTHQDKQNLSIVVHMCRVPVKFGTIIIVDLSAFISVIKTSFSYYNALRAFDIK